MDIKLFTEVSVIDDFHWADPDSVQALRFLSRNVQRLPALLVVALREDEVEDPLLREVLRDLRKEHLVRTVPLAGFKEVEAQQLLESVLHAPFDTSKVRGALVSLLGRTGGNPYFLVETAHQLQGAGKVQTIAGRAVITAGPSESPAGPGLAVPRTVSDLLGKRLAQLSPAEITVLQAAAILGEEFDVEPLQDTLGLGAGQVRALLERLCGEKMLLVSAYPNSRSFAFPHALLWETVKGSTPEDKRTLFSRHLARWWEQHRPTDPERIFQLYASGEEVENATRWMNEAVALAFQNHAHQKVLHVFDQGVDILSTGSRGAEEIVRWGLPILEKLTDDGADGKIILRVSVTLLGLKPSLPLTWEIQVLRDATNVLLLPEARQELEKIRAEVWAARKAKKGLKGRILLRASELSYYEGSVERSVEEARGALQLLTPEDTYFRGAAHYDLGWIAMDQNDWDRARYHLERALAAARDGKHWGLQLILMSFEAAVSSLTGDLLRAETLYAEAAEASGRQGKQGGHSVSLSNLCGARMRRGDLDGAEQAARKALHIAETFGLPRETGAALQYLGVVQLRRGGRTRVCNTS